MAKDILPTERTHESENKEVKMFTITYEGEAKSHIHKLFMRYIALVQWHFNELEHIGS